MNLQRLRHGALLAAVAMLTGCQQQLQAITAAYPGLTPYLVRPQPQAFSLNTGNVTGFVFGASGADQPIPLAFVTTGSVSTFAGNPDPAKALPEANEFDDSANAAKNHLDVLHDFNDGKGPVAADRILRQQVPAADPNADDATNARRQYVYLRAGEFFLEGVPEGIVNLQASFGNVSASGVPCTVYAHQLVTGVNLNLFIPEPVRTTDGRAAHVVEWTGLFPGTGVSVTVQPKDVTNADGSTDHQVSLSYKPDPPDVQVTLKAPPGSAGAVIKAVDVVYVFNTQFRQSQGLPPLQIGPIRAPLPPIVVGPAQDIAFGPPAQITIPIGSSSLASVFNPLDASGRPDHDPTKQPGLIVANMEFIDDGGFAIQDKGFQNLQVSAVLRSL